MRAIVNNTVLIDRRSLGLRSPGGTRGGVMQAWSCRRTGQRIPSQIVPDRTAVRGPCRGRELANRRDLPLCHTCSLRQPSGSSAPLRHGEAPLGAAPGRPWLRPNLR